MKYFVVTTKHHEGFSLWDSKVTPGSRGKEAENTETLRLPVRKPDVEVPVIELFLK